MYLFRTCLSVLRMWIPPAVLIGTAAGLSVYVIAKFIRERRKADEKTPDYIALHELAKDLHRQSLQAVAIVRKLRSMEFGGSEAADVTISWESVSSRNGEENISVSGGQEVTVDYLEAVLDETGERIEESILNLIGWYQGNIGPLPFPSDDFSNRQKPLGRRKQNESKTMVSGGKSDQQAGDENHGQPDHPRNVPRKMWRFAWRLKGGSGWTREAFQSRKEAEKHLSEIQDKYPVYEMDVPVFPDYMTGEQLEEQIGEWERLWEASGDNESS